MGCAPFSPPRRRCFLALGSGFLLAAVGMGAGCATRQLPDGRRETTFDPSLLAKTDIDRVVEIHRTEVVASLRRLTDKLYRRNPREWRKGNQPSLEAAVALVFDLPAARQVLGGRREREAALLAFREDYTGDRVLALMGGLMDMVDGAFENKEAFYLLDSLDAQKLYNCARNVEVAAWKLNSARDGNGEPLLYANVDGPVRNLTFEREVGRTVGLLDTLARIVVDKNGRAVTRVTHSLATAIFLPVKF